MGSISFLFQVDLIPIKINGYFCGDISLKYPFVPLKKGKLHVVCEGVIVSLIAVRNFFLRFLDFIIFKTWFLGCYGWTFQSKKSES